MKNRFTNKIVLITGGNSGMGKATARRFQEEGATVIISGRNEQTLAETARELGVTTIASDAGKVDDIERLIERIGVEFGHLDVLFANAGICRFASIEEMTEEIWDSVMDINLKGVYFLVARAAPLLTPGGSVILNASVGAHNSGSTAYGASKAGVRLLGRSLAAELLPRGVRVNTISPGPIDTPIYQRDSSMADGLLQHFTSKTHIKREGTPEEVAGAVAFLASEDASYIVGVDLLIDGGLISL